MAWDWLSGLIQEAGALIDRIAGVSAIIVHDRGGKLHRRVTAHT